jgi:hypothetical protein
MYITEQDVNMVVRSALIRVAKCIRLEDFDLKSNQEIYNEIRNSQTDLIYPLNTFINSYIEWYIFHKIREHNSIISQADKIKLSGLMSNRDKSREQLIEILYQKGC